MLRTHVGVLASKCAEISVARVPLTFEVLDALKETLEHLENVRMFDPQDKLISDLKLSIREKIAEIEERESGSKAA